MKNFFIEILSASKYGVIGIVSTLVNYTIFIIALNQFNFSLIVSLTLGFFSGSIFSLYFGRKWIFGIRNKFKITQLFKFIISYLIGFLILNIMNYKIDGIYSNPSYKWLLITIPIIISNYCLLKFWVFENNQLIYNKRWGGISKIEFLQVFASSFISYLNPAITHNIEKYYAIKKAFYLSCIEKIEGDYLEFGVYEGSSFNHAIRCYLNKKIYMPINREHKVRFFGFDSFDGFDNLSSSEKHPFYIDEQFKTSYEFVQKKVSRLSKKYSLDAYLIKGFLKDTLRDGSSKYGIQKARIIFIDLDIYTPSIQALLFCKDLIQEGTILILDDFFSYRGSLNKGVAKAFNEFKELTNYKFREISSYGMGGKIFICSSK